LWLLFDYFISLKTDVNWNFKKNFSHRWKKQELDPDPVRKPMIRIRVSGSVQKCNGSKTPAFLGRMMLPTGKLGKTVNLKGGKAASTPLNLVNCGGVPHNLDHPHLYHRKSNN
jgi:hypothetical protein